MQTAYCGIDRSGCPAFRAWRDDDDQLRERTAAEWSRLYQADIKPEQVSCRGCRSPEPPRFSHCEVCAVRACASDKGWENCAPCPDYPCNDLSFIHKFAPEAQKALDRLRASS